MKESFENVDCEFLQDMEETKSKINSRIHTKSCMIASSKEGCTIPTTQKNCEACMACERPKSYNKHVAGLINLNRYEKGTIDVNAKEEKNSIESLTMPNYVYSHGGSNVKTISKRGVGDELKRLIPKAFETKGCGCQDYARKMNAWGVKGCRKRVDEIVNRLVEKTRQTSIFGWVPINATRVVAKRLVDIAISRSDKGSYNSLPKPDKDFKWFVALTTAPRVECTLRKCTESLFLAGFKPVIFAEPGSTTIEGCTTIINKERKGVWHNWLQSCKYALENSDADVIMTVQDDALFHPDSKVFVEKILWPDKATGFVSLYTPKHYTLKGKSKKMRPIGVNRIHTRSMWGACALVWPREVLELVVEHGIAKKWLGAATRSKSARIKQKRIDSPHLIQNSDTAIGKIMNKMKRKMFFVDPSPVQHFSRYSAINHGGNLGRRNCHRCAEWETPLDGQVLVDFKPVKIKI